MNWKNAVAVAPSITPALAVVAGERPSAAELRDAAVRFDARRDAFAAGKGAICRDIAGRVDNGGYASAKQRDFAGKLVEWSLPRQPLPQVTLPGTPAAPAKPAYAAGTPVPKLFEVMQKHATLHAGALKISRKNQDSMCWLVWNDRLVGKLDNAQAFVWNGKAGADKDAIVALLAEFELDPLAAAVRHGKLSGRCCSCGRDLTDPASIEAGIGPICAGKFE